MLQHYDAVHGGDAADAGRGAARDLLDLPADLAQDRPRAAGAGDRDRRRRRHHRLRDEDGTLVETPVTGGHVKLQWKADWALRWAALDVDYEMYGKDLIHSAELSSADLPHPRRPPPEGFNYELFLDEKGQKISKSKGNGLTIEEWLRYAPPESLSLFMYQQPAARQAALLRRDPARGRRLSRSARASCRPRSRPRQLENPVWHIHDGEPPASTRSRRQLRHAAQPRERRERRRQGRAVGLHPPLRAGRHAGERALSRPPAAARGAPTTRTS